MKNILITREKNQAQEIEQLLESNGFMTFIEPLFLLEKIAIKKIPKAVAVIITSANACDALLNSNLSKNIKIFAVGKKTAERLFEKGFKNIVFPKDNTARNLKKLIIETHKDKMSLILYFHGPQISLDFETELKKLGFNVKKILSYKTCEIKNFSLELLEFCQKNTFAHVLIFSENNAKNFYNLARKHNLLEYFKQAEILVLSEKILTCVRNFGFENSKVFSEFPILKNFYD